VVSFAIPFIFSSVLGLQHDVYLGIYFAVVLVGFAVYALATGLRVRGTFRRHWKLGLAVGALVGFALPKRVLGQGDAPPARELLRL
jgi:hypothetical protein